MERSYILLIKFGDRKFMERLFYNGEIYCRQLDYFRTIDEENCRGDKNEGAVHINQINNIKIDIKGAKFSSPNGLIHFRSKEHKGNLYCLFGLESEKLNLDSESLQKLEINLNGVSFGDTAVLIFKPEEFLNRINKAIYDKGLQGECCPINYYDDKKYSGPLSIFNKSKKYEFQSEVRYWIPNNLKADLIFNIGNISDISCLMSIDMFDKLEYQSEE